MSLKYSSSSSEYDDEKEEENGVFINNSNNSNNNSSNNSNNSSNNNKRIIQTESEDYESNYESDYESDYENENENEDSIENESSSSIDSEEYYDDETSSEEEEIYGSKNGSKKRKKSKSNSNSKNNKSRISTKPKLKTLSGIVSDEEEEYEEDESDDEIRDISKRKIAPTGEIPFNNNNDNNNNNNNSLRIIDQIGDWNEEKKEFLIKWKGKSWKWAEWLGIDAPEIKLGKRKIENFIKKIEEEKGEKEINYTDDSIGVSLTLETLRYNLIENWCSIERIVSMEETLTQGVFYLCKWRALGYSECTWEWEGDVRGFGADASHKIDEFLTRQYSNFNSKSIKSRSSKTTIPFKSYKEQPEYFNTHNNTNTNTDTHTHTHTHNNTNNLVLRDYQLDGLNWLIYSWCRGVNVILADEMGLGKTIQSVCFLTSLKIDYKMSGPTLLVVPLSTIDAWQREFGLWAGERINVIVYTGDASSRATARKYEFPGGFDVLLTTYELVLKDHSILEGIKWKLLMVDEGHRLKNSASQLYDVLFSLVPTSGRVLITGTPLQNSLGELWCLLRFLMPEKFSDYEDFLQKYSVDLEDNKDDIGDTDRIGNIGDTDGIGNIGDTSHITNNNTNNIPFKKNKNSSLNELHSLIKPHILRRLKRDVEHSLPGKSEKIIRVDLSPLQKQLYRYILTKNYRDLKKTQEAAGNRAVGSLVNILGELKKICNHPLLLGTGSPALKEFKSDESSLAFKPEESGKLILLKRLLKRLKDDGHRVLIFSQSVRMLDLLQSFVKSEGYCWRRLDGSTTSVARHLAITGFNAPESNDFVFLLSTRAGGLGINLATADTVIIYDSDWNPQNDLQAMARAHRIGQKKMVRIFRLVSAGTVEEEILERAKRKMVLDHLVIQQLKGNSSDLQAILKFGAKSLFNAECPGISAEAIDLDSILTEVNPLEEKNIEIIRDDEEFLGQFRMADLGVVPNWDEIIPEEERKRIEEEDKQADELVKEVELQEALLTAATGRRHRNVSVSTDNNNKKNKDEDIVMGGDRKVKLSTKTKEDELVLFDLRSNDNEENLIKAYDSLSKFGNWQGDFKWEKMIYDRLESLASGNEKETISNHFRIIPSGPLLKASLPKLLERFKGLKILNESLNNYKIRSPDDIEMKSYRHSLIGVSTPTNWPIPLYSVQQDSALLVAVGKIGYGSWQAIRQELFEKNSSGWMKLQGPQITRRVDYLLKEMIINNKKMKSQGVHKTMIIKNANKSKSSSNNNTKQSEEVRIIEKYRRPFKGVRGTLLALDGLARGLESSDEVLDLKNSISSASACASGKKSLGTTSVTTSLGTTSVTTSLGNILTNHLILLGDFIETTPDLKNDPEAWEFVGCFWPFQRGSTGNELKKLYESLKN